MEIFTHIVIVIFLVTRASGEVRRDWLIVSGEDLFFEIFGGLNDFLGSQGSRLHQIGSRAVKRKYLLNFWYRSMTCFLNSQELTYYRLNCFSLTLFRFFFFLVDFSANT